MSGKYEWLNELSKCEKCGTPVPQEELNGDGECIDCETDQLRHDEEKA